MKTPYIPLSAGLEGLGRVGLTPRAGVPGRAGRGNSRDVGRNRPGNPPHGILGNSNAGGWLTTQVVGCRYGQWRRRSSRTRLPRPGTWSSAPGPIAAYPPLRVRQGHHFTLASHWQAASRPERQPAWFAAPGVGSYGQHDSGRAPGAVLPFRIRVRGSRAGRAGIPHSGDGRRGA